MSSSLSGLRIAITGASSGIGNAITEQLLAQGAQVFALCRQTHQVPSGATAISCDLTRPEDITQAFEAIGQSADGLNALINNAGLAWLTRVSDGDPARMAEMWQVNVHGLTLCTQAALKLFPVSGGRIINISSLSGHRVPPTGGFYSPTKFAVRAITEALRSEFAQNGLPNQVATISPGFVDTPLLDRYFEGREEELAALRESGSMLQPSDIATAVLSILSSPPHVSIGDIQLRPSGQKI